MLTLHGNYIPNIGNRSIKFLGAYIQIPPDHNRMRDHLMSKLNSLLNKVNSVPVSRQQKLLLYRAAICPRLLWDLRISDLPMLWVTKCLEATATRFLKKWSGLCRSADPSRLYLPKKNGGLDLPNIATLYKKIIVSTACQLLLCCDPTTQQVCKRQVLKEEAQKRATFTPMLMAREVVAADPGAGRKTILKRAKALVMTLDAKTRLDHAKSLSKQG